MLSIGSRLALYRRYNTGEDFDAEESRTAMRYGRPKADILLPNRMTNYVSSQSHIFLLPQGCRKIEVPGTYAVRVAGQQPGTEGKRWLGGAPKARMGLFLTAPGSEWGRVSQ